MTRRTVFIGTRAFEVVPDGAGHDQVLVVGALLDDADARALARLARVSSDDPLAFAARSERDYALAGVPATVLGDGGAARDFTVRVQAQGYRDLTEVITVPAGAALPVTHQLEMRRLPERVTGRVFGLQPGPPPAHQPIASAELSLRLVPDDTGQLPFLLRQPLRADVGAGATLRRRALVAEADRTLIAPAQAGDRLLSIDVGSGVGPGQIFRFGSELRPRYGEVAAVLPHPDLPLPAALVELTEPLTAGLRADLALPRFTLGGFSGPSGGVGGPAYAGEAVLYLSSIPNPGGVLVLRQPGAPDRYHDANARTDADGGFLIDGFARVGLPEFEVSAPGFVTQITPISAARLRRGPVDWYLNP